MARPRKIEHIEHIRKNAEKSNAELAKDLGISIDAVKQCKKKYKIYKKYLNNTAY